MILTTYFFEALASANLGGIASVSALESSLLHSPVFGQAAKFSRPALAAGCDYCFWAVNLHTGAERGPGARLAVTRAVGRIQVDTVTRTAFTIVSAG